MLKPDSLRKFLTDGLVDGTGAKILERDPDKLEVFIDKGHLAAREAPAIGFELRYTLNLLFLDLPVQLREAVFLGIILWIRSSNVELIANHDNGNQAVRFEVDVIDSRSVDLSVELDLNEAVTATPNGSGGYDVAHPPEPQMDKLFDDVPEGTLLTRFFMKDDVIFDASGD